MMTKMTKKMMTKMEKRSTDQLIDNAVYGKTGKFKKKN